MSVGYDDYARLSLAGGRLLADLEFIGGTSQCSGAIYCGNFPYLMVTIFSANVPEYISVLPQFSNSDTFSSAYYGTSLCALPDVASTLFFATRAPWVRFCGQFYSATFTGSYTMMVFGSLSVPPVMSAGTASISPWARISATIAAGADATVVPVSIPPGVARVTASGGISTGLDLQAQVLEYDSTTWTTYYFNAINGVNVSTTDDIPLPCIPYRFRIKNNGTASTAVQLIGVPRAVAVGLCPVISQGYRSSRATLPRERPAGSNAPSASIARGRPSGRVCYSPCTRIRVTSATVARHVQCATAEGMRGMASWPERWRVLALESARIPVTADTLEIMRAWQHSTPLQPYTNNPVGMPASIAGTPSVQGTGYAQFNSPRDFYRAFGKFARTPAGRSLIDAMRKDSPFPAAWRAISSLGWPGSATETDYPSAVLDLTSKSFREAIGATQRERRKTSGTVGATRRDNSAIIESARIVVHASKAIKDTGALVRYLAKEHSTDG